MADVVGNSGHMALDTSTPTGVSDTTLQRTSSPDVWHTVQSDIVDNSARTVVGHLPIGTTINMRHGCGLQQNQQTFTNYKKADWTEFTENTVCYSSGHLAYQYTHCQRDFHKHHTDDRQAQHTKGQDAQQLQDLTRRHSMQNRTK